MNPVDVARRAMLELANKKLPPTPANYTQMYESIAGGGSRDAMTAAEAIELLSARIPNRDVANELYQAVRRNDWRGVSTILEEELRQAGERAQAGAESDTEALTAALLGDMTEPADEVAAQAASTEAQIVPKLASLLLHLMEGIEPPVPGMAALRARERLLYTLAKCESPGELLSAIEEVVHAWEGGAPENRGEAGAGGGRPAQQTTLAIDPEASPAAITQGIGEVIMLLVNEIEEVVPEGYLDDDELRRLRALLRGSIDLGRLKDVKRATRSIIIKGGIARYGLSEAKAAIAIVVDSLIRRVTEGETGNRDYARKLRAHGDGIARSSNLVTLTYGLNDLLAQINIFSNDMLRARDDLAAERRRVAEFLDRARALEREVESLRMGVRRDASTNVLSRPLLEEAYAAELNRTDDPGRETCLAIIAIDEIAKILELYGDADADGALQLLIQTVSQATRATDMVGRYDERKIVTLLTGTGVDGAVAVMARLQRNLTTAFYLRYRGKMLITFSCGVTKIYPGLSFQEAIDRAQAGVERAHELGKNKVVAT